MLDTIITIFKKMKTEKLVKRLFFEKKYEEAEQECYKYAEEEQDPAILIILGSLYLEENNISKAEEIFKHFKTDNSKYYSDVGYLYLKKGLYEKSIEWILQAAKYGADYDLFTCIKGIESENNKEYFSKAEEIYLEKGDCENAAKCFLEREKDIELVSAIASLGKQNDIYYLIAETYYRGEVLKQNYIKASKYYNKSIELFGAPDSCGRLAQFYLFGIGGVDQDLKKAGDYFERAAKNGFKEYNYYVNVLKKLKGKKIMTIESIADFNAKEAKDNGIEAVLIKPKVNLSPIVHTLYDIDTFNDIKEQMDLFLEDIPEVKEDRSNEFEVFRKICIKAARFLTYDFDIRICNDEAIFPASNLIGAMLKRKCKCGGYAELLRNLCASRNIECIVVGSKDHVFNQVKIYGKWYFFDLTHSRQLIDNYNEVGFFLQSKEKFQVYKELHTPTVSQTTFESKDNYYEKYNRAYGFIENLVFDKLERMSSIKKIPYDPTKTTGEFNDQKKEPYDR